MSATQKQQARIDQLIADGFDLTVPYGERWRMHSICVKCSQCAALVINGTPTHETGCPNQTFECKGCNARVSQRGAYCEDCR